MPSVDTTSVSCHAAKACLTSASISEADADGAWIPPEHKMISSSPIISIVKCGHTSFQFFRALNRILWEVLVALIRRIACGPPGLLADNPGGLRALLAEILPNRLRWYVPKKVTERLIGAATLFMVEIGKDPFGPCSPFILFGLVSHPGAPRPWRECRSRHPVHVH